MRIWAATRDMDKIIKEVVMDFPATHSEDEWNAVLGDICHELDLSRPVLLKKHLNELNTFRHTAFLPSDFMEGGTPRGTRLWRLPNAACPSPCARIRRCGFRDRMCSKRS